MNNKNLNFYAGIFLISFATLGFEVTLTRLLSVITWYYLAFFAISTALLGMTAGSTTVYLQPDWFTKDKLRDSIAKSCLGFAIAVPVSLLILNVISLYMARSTGITLLVMTITCTLPFYFSGIAVAAVLTKSPLPIGKLYASDLIGASLGCLFVLVGLEIFSAPGLILLCGAVGTIAAFSFLRHSSQARLRAWSAGIFIVLLLLVFLDTSMLLRIRPLAVKGYIENPANHLLERWNSFSRVVVNRGKEIEPLYWGASPKAPKDKKYHQYMLNIDGAASTSIRKFSSLEDIDHLRFDVTNVGYYLRPQGRACIIGVGGGRDAQSAILFGHESVVGIDVNPIFIDLLQDEFREFAGLADRQGVTLVADEARSYLARTDVQCSILQMSLVDTWAATGAGAFSLSENALYTLEGWRIFLSRLSDDGIYTVSRWYSPNNPAESGRIISLAVASLLESGVNNPSQNIALVATDRLATLLLSKEPFSEIDLKTLKEVSDELEYNLMILPGTPPNDETLRVIVSARSWDELNQAITDKPFNYIPPTDDNPYFFNMLQLSDILSEVYWTPGVGMGNLVATVTLLILICCLFLLTVITIVVPLMIKYRHEKTEGRSLKPLWSGALYFSLIGAGFMLVEIALIQRMSVFLSHPVYALGVLLFTIIASSGIGSFLSERLPLTRSPWVFTYPIVMAGAIILLQFTLPTLLSSLTTSPMTVKIVTSILVITPMGMVMGVFFPTGMRLVKSINDSDTPWYWALNGVFGVLCSALAVFFSIYFGISTNFYVGAACYATLLICIYDIRQRGRLAHETKPPP